MDFYVSTAYNHDILKPYPEMQLGRGQLLRDELQKIESFSIATENFMLDSPAAGFLGSALPFGEVIVSDAQPERQFVNAADQYMRHRDARVAAMNYHLQYILGINKWNQP